MEQVISMQIFGAKEVSDSLKKFGTRVTHKITRKSLRKGGQILYGRILSETPVDTGLMKSLLAMKVKKAKRSKFPYIAIEFKNSQMMKRTTSTGLRRKTKNGVTKMAKGAYWYPAAVHYGHDNVAPNPWMTRATESAFSLVTNTVMDSMKQEVEKEAKRQGNAARRYMKQVSV